MSRTRFAGLHRKEPLKLGFMPVSDCAPLVYAWENGLFAKYGLDVELHRVTSWTGIRDGIIQGELDAAQAPATLPFLANLGLESDPCACVSGLVLSLQGSAIAVGRQLWEQGVRDARTLKEAIYRQWRKRTYTFAVAAPYSPPHLILRQWLKSAGIVPEVEIRVVIVPAEQMFPTLKLGYIDGFCTHEPWTSMAVQAGLAVSVARSADLAPLHPDKVLMVRQSFAAGQPEEHDALLAALLESSAQCEQSETRHQLSEVLSHRQYVNAPAESLLAGFLGAMDSKGMPLENPPNHAIFHRSDANDPTEQRAAWLMRGLYDALGENLARWSSPERSPVLKNVFCRDLFARARNLARNVLQEAPQVLRASLRGYDLVGAPT